MEGSGMDEQRTPQEYAYITDGITTRMQMVIEKFAATVRVVCLTAVLVVIIVVAGFLLNNHFWMQHANSAGGVVSHAEVSQLGYDPGD